MCGGRRFRCAVGPARVSASGRRGQATDLERRASGGRLTCKTRQTTRSPSALTQDACGTCVVRHGLARRRPLSRYAGRSARTGLVAVAGAARLAAAPPRTGLVVAGAARLAAAPRVPAWWWPEPGASLRRPGHHREVPKRTGTAVVYQSSHPPSAEPPVTLTRVGPFNQVPRGQEGARLDGHGRARPR